LSIDLPEGNRSNSKFFLSVLQSISELIFS
ncbi:MAG: hypothetical protein ACI8X3_003472, partial [Saprospiraceae bacterium]